MKDTEERIICAAIWYKDFSKPIHSVVNVDSGVVMCGYRHGYIMGQFKALTGSRTPLHNHVQGFLTTKNRFIDRIEAHKLFVSYGGVPEFKNELYSEDLY